MARRPEEITKRRALAFAVAVNLAFFAVLEGLAALGLRYQGVPLTGEMAFHPLWRPHRLRSAAFDPERFSFDPYLGYRFTPSRGWVNEHGFVAPEGPFPSLSAPAKGARRVFVLGGSTVAGSGASSAARTIPAALGERLNSDPARRYEVVNAGVDGYFSFNELGFFQGDLLAKHPDAVVFYDGWNDYAYATWAGGYLDAYQRDHARQNFHEYALYMSAVMPTLSSPPVLNTAQLMSRTYTTAWLRNTFMRKAGTAASLQSTLDVRELQGKLLLSPEEAAGLYCANARSAVGTARAHGVPILFALQPTLLDKKNLTDEELSLLTSRQAFTRKDSNAKTIGRFYQAARTCLAALASRENGPGVRVVDLSHDMWDGVRERVYEDECHTNDRGNAVIAARLASELGRLRLRGPSPAIDGPTAKPL